MSNRDQPHVSEAVLNAAIDKDNPRGFTVPEAKHRPREKGKVSVEVQLKSLRNSYGSLRKEMTMLKADNESLRTRIVTHENILAEVAMTGEKANKAIMDCMNKEDLFVREIIDGALDPDGMNAI